MCVAWIYRQTSQYTPDIREFQNKHKCDKRRLASLQETQSLHAKNESNLNFFQILVVWKFCKKSVVAKVKSSISLLNVFRLSRIIRLIRRLNWLWFATLMSWTILIQLKNHLSSMLILARCYIVSFSKFSLSTRWSLIGALNGVWNFITEKWGVRTKWNCPFPIQIYLLMSVKLL